MRIVISWLTRLALPIKENLCPFSLLQTWLLFNYFGALRVTTIFSFSLFLLSSCYFSSSNYLLGNSIFHKCFFSGCVYMFAYSKTWFNCGVLQSTSKSQFGQISNHPIPVIPRKFGQNSIHAPLMSPTHLIAN